MSINDKRGNVVDSISRLSSEYKAIKRVELERKERNKKYFLCGLGAVGVIILLSIVF